MACELCTDLPVQLKKRTKIVVCRFPYLSLTLAGRSTNAGVLLISPETE